MLQDVLCAQNLAALRAEAASEGLQPGENADLSSSVQPSASGMLQDGRRKGGGTGNAFVSPHPFRMDVSFL